MSGSSKICMTVKFPFSTVIIDGPCRTKYMRSTVDIGQVNAILLTNIAWIQYNKVSRQLLCWCLNKYKAVVLG